MRNKSLNKQYGFTLIEIILGISILGSITVFIINLLTHQLQISKSINEITSKIHSLNYVLNLVSSDLKNSFLTEIPPRTRQNTTEFSSPTPCFIASNKKILFSTRNNASFVRDSPESNLIMVKYILKPDSKYSFAQNLVRVFDINLKTKLENESSGLSQNLLGDIKNFSLEFWNGQAFTTEWNSSQGTTENKIPPMVKIKIEIYKKSLSNTDPVDIGQQETLPTIKIETIIYATNSKISIDKDKKNSSLQDTLKKDYSWQ